MRGEEYLKKKEQFHLVYDRGKPVRGKLFSVRVLPNSLDITRYGFITGRRVGRAVARNRLKRRLREIARQMPLKMGWDIVFYTGSEAAAAGYSELKETTVSLLSKARLLVENYEKSCPGAN